MKTINWLEMASTFNLGNSKKYFYNGYPENGAPITLSKMEQIDGSTKWTVRLGSYCLGKDGNYYAEQIPSGRSEAFIAMCRFDTKEEAYETWVKNENTPKIGKEWIDVKYI